MWTHENLQEHSHSSCKTQNLWRTACLNLYERLLAWVSRGLINRKENETHRPYDHHLSQRRKQKDKQLMICFFFICEFILLKINLHLRLFLWSVILLPPGSSLKSPSHESSFSPAPPHLKHQHYLALKICAHYYWVNSTFISLLYAISWPCTDASRSVSRRQSLVYRDLCARLAPTKLEEQMPQHPI